jgi:hypothetical protein
MPDSRQSAAVLSAPPLGAGVGYRAAFSAALIAEPTAVDVVEILADSWWGATRMTEVRGVCERLRTVPHGVGMSLAGAGRVNSDYLAFVKSFAELCQATYYSEHLAVTHVPGIDSDHLCPPILSEESLRRCMRNVSEVQDSLGMPLAVENITYDVALSEDHLDGATFLAELVEATDALILLDVTNLHINAVNNGFDPIAYLDRLPLDRVAHIHLAGGLTNHHGKMIDSHSEPVGEQIWRLAEYVAAHTKPHAVILEHDQNFPAFEDIVRQVDRSRSVFYPESQSQPTASR